MSGQNGCLCDLDPSVAYDGPRATIATLGGSPTWGLGDRFHELAAQSLLAYPPGQSGNDCRSNSVSAILSHACLQEPSRSADKDPAGAHAGLRR